MATKKATKAAEVTVEAPVVEAEVKEETKKAPAKKAAKKTTKKAAEEKVVEVKAEEVVEEVKEVKKAPAKKAACKKETVITLEFGDYTANMTAVEERVKAQYEAEGNKASKIKTLNIYVKPLENSAYYVINGTETGRVDLF